MLSSTIGLDHKTFHNLSFIFLVGITDVPMEIKDNAYAKVWGVNKVYYGRCENGEL